VQEEAACMGAAIIGAVREGHYPDYRAAAESLKVKCTYYPDKNYPAEKKYKRFQILYDAMLKIVRT
jgi:xylulokinase